MARDRAGLSQEQLAARSKKPRSTIARWESGARSPSLENLEDVIRAAGLDLVVGLAESDHSLDELTDDQLSLDPEARLRTLLPGGTASRMIKALGVVADLETPVIVIGPLAGALQGAPQRPRGREAEIVPGDREALLRELAAMDAEPTDDEQRFGDSNRRWRWTLQGAELVVVDRLAGAADYRDLKRDAVELSVDAKAVKVAHPRDLLRLAEASGDEADRAYTPGLRALNRRLASR